MTTAAELASWRDAAVAGQLPAPARGERWQPLRAGVVNLWEYDAAEVWYSDGRLQLQGANESGKSTLMTLTTLLLLAGDVSSHNIDTLGQSEKRFRYYVEPTGHALDRRDATQPKSRGWAWLEFGTGTGAGSGPEFFTLLLFAESRRADGALKVQWCTSSGPARVRAGLTLASAGIVSDPAQLRDADGFTAHKSGTAYREEIARMLYGADTAWLDQVTRILRVVRTPQIGHRLDLKFLTDAFRIALPPIAEDEINQLADGWEQLQRLRDERDTTEQALGATSDFSRRSWRPWADSVIRAAADPVTAVTSKLTQITREEKSASDAVERISAEVAAVARKIAAAEQAQRTATARRQALKDTEAYQNAESAAASAQQLAEQADRAEDIAARSRRRADEADEAIAPAERQLSHAEAEFSSAERAVEEAAGKVAQHAADAGLADLTAQYLPGRDTARLRQAARQRIKAAEDARRLIEAQADALRGADSAAGMARDARARLARAQQAAVERETQVENAITAVAELLAGWASTLDQRIRPPAERVESWCRLVSDLTGAESPAPMLAAAVSRDHLIPARRPLDQRDAALERARQDNAAARGRAEAELAAVEAERDPGPRDPEFWSRRRRPPGITAQGAPLWRLVETRDQALAAQLEATLDAAGLLQAWVTPDGAYVTARDGCETIWAARPGPTTDPAKPTSSGTRPPGSPAIAPAAASPQLASRQRSLRAVLRPADDAADLTGVVEWLLAAVSYGDQLPDGDQLAVAADGRWRHGGLTGLATPSPDAPRLLGAAARAADRERRIGLLRAQLGELATGRERLAAELREVAALLGGLDAAAERLPTDSHVVSAVLAARQAVAAAEDAAAEAELADEAERQARLAADAAAASVAGHCGEHGLPRTRADVESVLRVLAEYQSALSGLDGRVSLLGPLRDTAGQAAQALQRCRAAQAKAAKDAEDDRVEALSLRAKAEAAQAALSRAAQEILTEVAELGRLIKTADATLKSLAGEREGLNTQRARAEAKLEGIEERRQEAEAERQFAVDRWFGCVNTGLPRLRGVADPAAGHVTAALDTARAARSAITIRDWPDDPNAAGQRVQQLWARMVDGAAILRSRLESLAGRTVRVIPPGEGAADFPGGVELIVDGTGATLAPPTAADRLADLLLRLQADYDEELTKTINELLGSTFIEHLRDRLAEAERLRDDINTKLAQNPTSISGITLRLRRVPVSAERAANDVLAALERDFTLLPETAQEQIRRFLADRVNAAQEEAQAKGDPDWRSRLAEILDYRRWFELRLEYRTPQSAVSDGASGGWRSLDRGDHGLLSQGAKVVTLLQPFIAALHAMYDQSGIGPRMLWLDEAFGGMDAANKASMFRLLASCDLDWLIAGPGIIANCAAVPLAAIYEVRRAPQPLPGVSLELALWTGNELTHILTPDPADLPDRTADEPVPADDALFSAL
jgi:Putative exonuclease SbcCD, C subunit